MFYNFGFVVIFFVVWIIVCVIGCVLLVLDLENVVVMFVCLLFGSDC